MARVLIVGGGILGTSHAIEALQRGWEVTHFEASAEPRASTPRSPGALHFSRCAPGLELDLARSAADSWRRLAARWDPALIRESGSVVVATDDQEATVLSELARRVDAEDRTFSYLDADAVHAAYPLFGPDVTAALRSDLDLVVEPRGMLDALRKILHTDDRYSFKGGVEVRDVDADSVTADTGQTHKGDLVVLCTGCRSDLTVSVLRQPSIIRSVQLQVAQTERFDSTLPSPLSDVAALSHSGLGRDAGITDHSADPLLGDTAVSLTCVQRRNRSLTLGEARDHDEPFGFDIAQRPTEVMMDRLAVILGRTPPPVTRQWVGVIRECTDGRLWLREDLDETVALVTAAGLRGITLAPVMAADTFNWLIDEIDSGATRPGADGGRVG